MLQNNPYKLTSQVALAPDPQLTSMMEKYKGMGDAVAFSVVFNEVQRRKEVRDAAQAKMSGGAKQKVADQLIQESKMAQMPPMPQGMGMPPQGMPPGGGMPPQGMPPQMAMGPQGAPQGMPPGGPPPQGLPEQSGIGQLPAPNMQNMAGGGLVSFAGDDESYIPFTGGIPYRTGYNPNEDQTETETEEEPTDQDYSRFEIGDAAGDYRKRMEEAFAKQQADIDAYKADRNKFGSAYAGAEDRDKEMNQRYADEERVQRGLPWILGGAKLMQSNARGLGGIGEAVEAGLPAYLSGREKLAALKDKQRDFMQTVAEARRAEQRGDTDKLFALQQSMATQRTNMEGMAAQLGVDSDKVKATYASAGARGSSLGTDKLAAYYKMESDKYKAAASNPKISEAERKALLQESERLQQESDNLIAKTRSYPSSEAGFAQTAAQKFFTDKADTVLSIRAQLKNPRSREDALKAIENLANDAKPYRISREEIYAQFNLSPEGGATAGSSIEDPLGIMPAHD